MAYHGYIPFIHKATGAYKTPRILEIGVSSGITLFALLQRLSHSHQTFSYTGVDVLVQGDVRETVRYMSLGPQMGVDLIEENSLTALPRMVEEGRKFDVILVDGDHNYFTVSQELPLVNELSHESTLIVIDDYDGRWSNRDLFYSTRDELEGVEIATPPPSDESEKQGVKPAVDEFVLSGLGWSALKLMPGEPIVLVHEKTQIFEINTQDEQDSNAERE